MTPATEVPGPPDFSDRQAGDPGQREKVYVSSELFASFLVAFEAQKEYWRERGVELTPRELTLRHQTIGCQRDESGLVDVTFYPDHPMLGGGVRYYVDPKELKIVKRRFGR